MSARYEKDLFSALRAPDAVERLRRYLAEHGRCRVELIPTRNRVSMISVVFVRDGHARIRLHEQFLEAPTAVYDALATYLRTRRRAVWTVVADYARQIHVSTQTAPLTKRLQTRGMVYDLQELATEVNTRFFDDQIRYHIGWGARRARTEQRRTRSRSIRYGSWSSSTRTVRINPLLDDTRVPREFLSYIVFHEMLHAAVPGEHVAGQRRVVHGPMYMKQEGRYPEIARMRQMAKDLLHVLLDGGITR